MAEKDEVRGKVGGLLKRALLFLSIFLLLALFSSVGIYSFIRWGVPTLLEDRLSSLFHKPFSIGEVSPGWGEVRIRDIHLDNIFEADSIIVRFDLHRIILNRTLKGIEVFGAFFDSDSFAYYFPKGTSDDTGGEFSGFPSFLIRRVAIFDWDYRNASLRILGDSIVGNVRSSRPRMEFLYRGYGLRETKSIRKKADSALVSLMVRPDTLFFPYMYLWGDSILVDSMSMMIYSRENTLYYDARYFSLDVFRAYGVASYMLLDSAMMEFMADSFYSGDFPIYYPRLVMRFLDTLYVDTAVFMTMGGRVEASGYVKDTFYHFYGRFSGIRSDSATTLWGRAYVDGYTSGALSVRLIRGSLKYGDYYIAGLRGYIYTPDGKIYRVSPILIRDSSVKGRVEGYYDVQNQQGEFSIHLDTIYPGGFLDSSMVGMLDFIGRVNVGRHFLMVGGGSVNRISYSGVDIRGGVYSIKMMDSLLSFQGILDSIYAGSVELGRASVDISGTSKDVEYGFIGYTPYGRLFSTGNVHLPSSDTVYASFDLLYTNGDTILQIRAGTLMVEGSSMGLFLVGEGLRGQVLLDSPYINVYAVATGLDFTRILKPFGIYEVGGSGNATLVISGTFQEPEVYYMVDVDNFHYRDYRADYLYVSGGYAFDTIRVDSILVLFGNGRLHGHGYVNSAFQLNPFSLGLDGGESNLRIYMDSIDLKVFEPLFYPHLLFEKVLASGYVHVEGKLTKPVMKGRMAMQGDALMFAPMNIYFKNPGAWISFYRSVIRIDSFRAYGENGGRIRGWGLLNLGSGFESVGTEIALRMDNLYFSPDDYSEFYISGGIQTRGTIPSVFVEGDIDLNSGYISYPVGYNPPKKPETPSPIRYLFRIKGDRKIYFSNELVDAELSADIRVQKTAEIGQYIDGVFRIIRGKVYILDREFRITEGTITMVNQEINLNIRAEADVVEDTIIAILTGTLKEPKFELISRKGLSKYEILALLTLGGSLGARGINLAQTLLSRELRRMLRLDELIFSVTGNNALVTLGSYITDRIYVKIRTDLQNPDNTSLSVRYFLRPNVSLFGESEGNRYTVGIGYRIRF